MGISVRANPRINADPAIKINKMRKNIMLPEEQQKQTAIDWLNSKRLIFTKQITINSQDLQNLAREETQKYISSEAFAAAIKYLLIPYELIPDSPQIEVFLSKEIFKRKLFDAYNHRRKNEN